MTRGPFQEHVEDLPYQAPAAIDDEEPNKHADNRIGDIPAQSHDQNGGNDHAGGSDEVGHNVLERAFGVQAVTRRGVEYVGDDDVDEESAAADDQHQHALDFSRAFDKEPVVGLEEHPGGDQPQA